MTNSFATERKRFSILSNVNSMQPNRNMRLMGCSSKLSAQHCSKKWDSVTTNRGLNDSNSASSIITKLKGKSAAASTSSRNNYKNFTVLSEWLNSRDTDEDADKMAFANLFDTPNLTMYSTSPGKFNRARFDALQVQDTIDRLKSIEEGKVPC